MSTNVRFYLSYVIKITLKSHFMLENVKILYATLLWTSLHYIMVLNWFIDFKDR